MTIEGPLKELHIHDVFQLLDLGRKTGELVIMPADVPHALHGEERFKMLLTMIRA